MNAKMLMLVVDSDERYAKGLAGYAKEEGGFFDAAYAPNGEEGIELASMLRPDVVILEAVMPVLDGIGFLRRLAGRGIKKPVIIMNTAAQLSSMLSTAAGYGVDYFMLKPQSFESICQTARDMLLGAAAVPEPEKDKDMGIERSVTVFLRSLGMPAHLDGYKYMRAAIILTIDDPSVISPITKRLYPMIAKRFGTSKSCVERALRHAIGVSWERGNKKLLLDIFGYTNDSVISRPTNAEYIAMAADDFRLRLDHGII